MANKKQSKQGNRKPALSRVRYTERKKLVLQGRAITINNRITKAETALANLDKANVRLKITRKVNLTKSIARWKNQLNRVNVKHNEADEKLKVYSGIIW